MSDYSNFLGGNPNFDVGSIDTGDATGMDAFFASEPQIVSPVGVAAQIEAQRPAPPRIKVTRVSQLDGFVRTSSDQLINKSTQDLWAIRKNGDEFFIERLFQDDGEPLKG